jgi:hypothetical protein
MACCALAAFLFGVVMRMLGRNKRRAAAPVRSDITPPIPAGDRG